MPNWCSGNIRFRGKMDDILNFLRDNIECCYVSDVINEYNQVKTITEPPKGVFFDESGYEIEIILPNNKAWLHIKDTHRNFLDFNFSTSIYESENNDEYVVVFDSFKGAWGIDSEPYIEMSKKYNIDIHIFGWEQGMCYDREIEIEIVKGEAIKDYVHDYSTDEWAWGSDMPYFGG